jgi:glycosyltransferase involved in cell wall biosynthesis
MSKKARKLLTVAIPAFNEEDIIESTIDCVARTLRATALKNNFEILIIDDGSNDDTVSRVLEIQKTFSEVRLIKHLQNLGRGRAVRSAFNNFHGEVLVILDADLSYSADLVLHLSLPILENIADLTLASPYMLGGSVENVPRIRALISRYGNRILRNNFLQPKSTSTSIARGYSRALIDSLSLLSSGKELNLEVIYKAELLGFKVIEVPAKLTWPISRIQKASRDSFLSIFSMKSIVRSHLFFHFLSRPGILFGIPIIFSLIVFLLGFTNLLISLVKNIFGGSNSPLRDTLLEGSLTLYLSGFAFINSLLFTAIFFLFIQGKLYYEDLFTFLNKIRRDLNNK